MTDMTDASSAGASEWERDLYAHLTSHVEAERGLLKEYSAAAETSPSKALRYLVNLLIEDEIRHHRIFMEIADSLKTEALLGGEDPTVPYIDFDQATNHDAVIDLTEQLLRKEQQDAQELKRLRRELRDVKDTSLWSLLVDLMQRDTQKHIAILRFAKKHARHRRR
jgi:rubrerythrin